ncbi:glycoside hydrolase family 18 protein [Lentithecium fluviatile CBS 122367]|uniref:chitinase n=1 Tax=Lentithecium fluviatile CBS 122367 TaxID=1168545 RepID=A0A6G1J113_9PLEO|nr:glycoside hydrolase family 18 protein [Lentithecium fluviatile CBS 122367]
MRLLSLATLTGLAGATSNVSFWGAPRLSLGDTLPNTDSSGHLFTLAQKLDGNVPTCGNASGTAYKRSVAYYQAWNLRTRQCDRVEPSQIRTAGLSHLNLAFASIDPKSYKIRLQNPADANVCPQFTGLKSRGVQTWLGVGGWEFSDEGETRTTWSDMVSSKSNRGAFISTTLDMLHDLTCVLPHDYAFLKNIDVKSLAPYVDWFNVLNYDLHGHWDSKSPDLGAKMRAHTDLKEVDSHLNALWASGVESSKFNLGLAYYGRGYTAASSDCLHYGCDFTGPLSKRGCANQDGVISNCELKRLIQSGFAKTGMITGGAGAKMAYWDNQWVSYDDDETIAMKKDLANDRCMGGTAIWAIDYECAEGGSPGDGPAPIPGPSSSTAPSGAPTGTPVPSQSSSGGPSSSRTSDASQAPSSSRASSRSSASSQASSNPTGSSKTSNVPGASSSASGSSSSTVGSSVHATATNSAGSSVTSHGSIVGVSSTAGSSQVGSKTQSGSSGASTSVGGSSVSSSAGTSGIPVRTIVFSRSSHSGSNTASSTAIDSSGASTSVVGNSSAASQTSSNSPSTSSGGSSASSSAGTISSSQSSGAVKPSTIGSSSTSGVSSSSQLTATVSSSRTGTTQPAGSSSSGVQASSSSSGSSMHTTTGSLTGSTSQPSGTSFVSTSWSTSTSNGVSTAAPILITLPTAKPPVLTSWSTTTSNGAPTAVPILVTLLPPHPPVSTSWSTSTKNGVPTAISILITLPTPSPPLSTSTSSSTSNGFIVPVPIIIPVPSTKPNPPEGTTAPGQSTKSGDDDNKTSKPPGATSAPTSTGPGATTAAPPNPSSNPGPPRKDGKCPDRSKPQMFGSSCGWMGLHFGPGYKGDELNVNIDAGCSIFGCDECAIWGCGGGCGIFGCGGQCLWPGGCSPCPPKICKQSKCTKSEGCGPKTGEPSNHKSCEENQKTTVTKAFSTCTDFVLTSASVSTTSSTCTELYRATLTGCGLVGATTTRRTTSKAAACTRAPLSLDDDEDDNEGIRPDPPERVNSTATFDIPTIPLKPSTSSSKLSSSSSSSSANPSATPIHNGGTWKIKIQKRIEHDHYVFKWFLIDSNSNEAGRGNFDSTPAEIRCMNRPESDRLPFDITVDAHDPRTADFTNLHFTINSWMPNRFQPKWWSDKTDPDGKPPKELCWGYEDENLGCEYNSPLWKRDKGRERNYDCWFKYMGTGGDRAPPGSKRGIDGGAVLALGGEPDNETFYEAAVEEEVPELPDERP